MPDPERRLFSGRDSDIFDHGPGLVLRQARGGRSMEKEAQVMRYLVGRGYPVPRVEDVSADGSALVMERIDGPTMLEALWKRPWALHRHAATLAGLHRDLHAIRAPGWLPAFGVGGDRIIHLDLHPLNVILAPRGPVVIDWTNAARGAAAADVAVSWLVMSAAEVPGGALPRALGHTFRRLFVRSFLGHFDLAPIRAVLRDCAEWKCRDPHMRDSEVAAMRRLVDVAAGGSR